MAQFASRERGVASLSSVSPDTATLRCTQDRGTVANPEDLLGGRLALVTPLLFRNAAVFLGAAKSARPETTALVGGAAVHEHADPCLLLRSRRSRPSLTVTVPLPHGSSHDFDADTDPCESRYRTKAAARASAPIPTARAIPIVRYGPRRT